MDHGDFGIPDSAPLAIDAEHRVWTRKNNRLHRVDFDNTTTVEIGTAALAAFTGWTFQADAEYDVEIESSELRRLTAAARRTKHLSLIHI